MILSELIDDIRRDMEHAGEQALPKKTIIGYINRTRLKISQVYPFDCFYQEAIRPIEIPTGETETLQRYGLPPDFSYFRSVYLNSKKVYKWPPSFHDELVGTDDPRLPAPGETLYYMIQGTEIELRDRPSEGDILKLAYYAVPPDLNDDGNYDFLSVNYPDAIVYGSDMRAARYLGDGEKVFLYRDLFQQEVAEMIQHEETAHKKDEQNRMLTASDYPISSFRKRMKLK